MEGLEIDGMKSWSLQNCQNKSCHSIIWDRNVPAAINILYDFYVELEKKIGQQSLEEMISFQMMKMTSNDAEGDMTFIV